MSNSNPPALPGVDAEPVLSAPLSRHYDTPDYRATAERRPTWTPIKNAGPRASCDECAQLQQETRGASGMRARPRHRRSFAGENAATALRVCSPHEVAWKERDDAVLWPAVTAARAKAVRK